MKARLIYNPTSGKEILKKNLADILNVMEQAGYESSAYATTPEPFSAKNEATRCALSITLPCAKILKSSAVAILSRAK